MIALTAALAALFSLLATSRASTGAGIGILILAMMLWPEAWRVPVGLVQLSVPRMVALALLVRLLASGRHYQVHLNGVDRLVVLVWGWTVLATVLAGAEFSQISQMIGRGFDTVLMYFVARLALTEPGDLTGLIPGLVVTAVLMAVMGVFEAVTHTSPYHNLLAGHLDEGAPNGGGYDAARLGLMRARGSTSISIFFGMAMMLLLGFIWSARGYVAARTAYLIAVFAALMAALSSMSSGPWIACFLLIALQFFYPRPHLIKPALQLGLLTVIFLEILSNRHFYELVDHLALDSQTAWYRTRLLEVAFSRWQDFWLVGVGSDWPHHWAALVDGREHIDVVNHFIIVALYGGVPAAVMYIASHMLAIAGIVSAWQGTPERARRMLLFGLGSTLLALDIASMSVGLFGPPLLLSHILLGAAVSCSEWAHERRGAPGLPPHQPLGGYQSQSPLRGHRYID